MTTDRTNAFVRLSPLVVPLVLYFFFIPGPGFDFGYVAAARAVLVATEIFLLIGEFLPSFRLEIRTYVGLLLGAITFGLVKIAFYTTDFEMEVFPPQYDLIPFLAAIGVVSKSLQSDGHVI